MGRSTFSVAFYVRKTRTNKHGESAIVVRVTVDGMRADTAAKKMINPKLWDTARGKAPERNPYTKAGCGFPKNHFLISICFLYICQILSSQKHSNIFAEKIRQLREDKQLLQRQISAALEMDNALYCKIERGDRIARREQVIKLAALLDTDKEELLKLWLADKVYDIVGEEDTANDVLNIVARNIVDYTPQKSIMNLQSLLLHEERLMQKAISSKYSEVSTARVQETINVDLSDTERGIAYKTHHELISSLIYTYLAEKGVREETCRKYFECDNETDLSLITNIETTSIPTFCEELHIAFLNSKFEYQKGRILRLKSKNNLIEKGAVYTKPNIVKEIIETTIDNYANNNADLSKISILDFACGTGRFYENIISTLTAKYGFSADQAILKHTFAIDIDPIAVNVTRLKAIHSLSEITEERINKISKNILLRNALIRNGMFSEENSLSENDFAGLHNGRFDIVVSNPPYLVLKINKDKEQGELSAKIQKQVSYFRNSGIYHYSIEGMLNYYQLSIEAILSMTKSNGEIGIICPTSLFADISATKLRKYLLLKHKLRGIKYFAEKEPLFENVTQATNIFFLQKSGITTSIEVEESGNSFHVELALVKQLFPDKMEIPFITEMEWTVLKKISDKNKLKQIPSVRNRRGELDLTLYKSYITNKKTPFRLVRGNMISENGIKDINDEFVEETFVQLKSSDFIKNDFRRKRLVCQQIANAGLKRRLKFVFCDETDILGNSCNYLSGDRSILLKLNLILNSGLLNWRFKITSTNNHINNYELDELPIVDLQLIDENFCYQSQMELDEYVGEIYGLEKDELQFILQR